jgi:outer membrane protein OmpA-like peptidoglycan-associated protein
MTRLRILAPLLLLAVAACARPENYVVLLDKGAPSALTVTTGGGSVQLDTPGEAVRLAAADQAPAPVALPDPEVRRIWAAALAHEPPAPVSFLLYFLLDSTTLTPDSRAKLPDVLAAVRARPAPEVTIAGYTDRSGPPDYNIALGLRRARAVARDVVAAGVPREAVETRSYGAAQPLVETRGAFEPRNRRVEITVR